MSAFALALVTLQSLPVPHGELTRHLQRELAADLIAEEIDSQPDRSLIERHRIAEHSQGWNDAARGRLPQSRSFGYALGYADARRRAA